MTPAASAAKTAAALPDCDVAAGILDADLAWSLHVTTRAFARLTSTALAELPGGPRGYLVLATVARGLPPSQLALAHQLGVDKTAMTYLLDELEASSLIERHPDPADRRARQVVITAKGIRALSASGDRLRAAEEQLLAPLATAEAEALRGLLDRVARAVQNGTGDCAAELRGSASC
jgi:DNA-binding MarR family transcriptional regulator